MVIKYYPLLKFISNHVKILKPFFSSQAIKMWAAGWIHSPWTANAGLNYGWSQAESDCTSYVFGWFPNFKRWLGVPDRHKSLSKMSHGFPVNSQLNPFQRKRCASKMVGSRKQVHPLHPQYSLCVESGFLSASSDQCMGGSGRPLILRLTQKTEKNRAHFWWLIWPSHAIVCF